MISQLITKLFHQQADAIEKLDKGLTNNNYKVTLNNKQYVLRVPIENSEHIVNYHAEKKALEVIQPLNLDATTIYYDENTGIKITEFIPDLLGFNDYEGEDKCKRVGQLMRKLHDAQTTIGIEFDPLKTYETYASFVSTPFIDEVQAKPYIDFIVQHRTVSTLCHNDWVPDNIGFHVERDVLLDYEYAGDNDPLFDVTSFLSENNITDKKERKQFTDAYFGHPLSLIEEETLLYWEAFHHILWCSWALMMYEQRKKPVYLHIAQAKKQAFDNIHQQLQP